MKKYLNEEITKEEALELFELKGSELMDLFSVANKVREKYCGNEIYYCTITNAKSGKCGEDCKFCAQSAHYNTDVAKYDLKEMNVLNSEYNRAKDLGSRNFGIVTSGRAIRKGSKDFEDIKDFFGQTDQEVKLCASLGMLTYEEALELKESGLTRYHNNIQTALDSYDNLVSTTHNVMDRVESIKNAKKAGLKVCSGGIIGMGETYEDRVNMAFTLKELNVDTIPLNILNPIEGTPHGNREVLSSDEILKTFAIFRLILKDKTIKIAAGRETILKDFMGLAFMAGANGMLVGGYLTLKGRSVEEDKKFIENIKAMWA